MKFMGSFLLGLLLAVSVKALTKEEKMEMMKPLVMECQAQEKATDADVAEMIKHEIPSTQEGKCFHACLQAKIGVVVNGAYEPNGVVELTKKLTSGDAAKVKMAGEMAEACKDRVTSGDRCELAFQLISCMEGEAEKRGIATEY